MNTTTLTRSVRKLQQLGLQSPRALALAKDDATRAVLQDDDSEAGRRFRADEQQWRGILAEPDPVRLRERVTAHLKAGATPPTSLPHGARRSTSRYPATIRS